jgi:hypothetical protein
VISPEFQIFGTSLRNVCGKIWYVKNDAFQIEMGKAKERTEGEERVDEGGVGLKAGIPATRCNDQEGGNKEGPLGEVSEREGKRE